MRAYVYQAYVPAGGTYMAYHVGRVLDQRFGLEVLVVGAEPETDMFSYPVRYPVVDESRFLGEVTAGPRPGTTNVQAGSSPTTTASPRTRRSAIVRPR